MDGTTDSLAKLTALVTGVVASEYSDFYRTHYRVPKGSVPNIHSFNDWCLVPYFTKDDVLNKPMREYTFVPHNEVELVYYTSGTSGKPPAFFGRVKYTNAFSYRKAYYSFVGACLSSVKAQHRTDEFLKTMGSESRSLNFDGKHLAACVRLAAAVGVDSMSVHTFTIQAIGEEMKKFGMNENIKLIDYVGETCSLALYSYMRATFPNATIISNYGMSESEGIVAVPCRALSDEEPYPVYHAHPSFHLDLINSETEEPLPVEPGTEAEVLVTDYSLHRTLPLVRYRPGDTVRVIEKQCKAHGQWTFTVLGKTASDFMLVPGGQLRADEIERVLRTMPLLVTDHFEMHRFDGGTKEKPMLEVILHVQALKPNTNFNELASTIAKELRVAPNRTYQMGVGDGRYVPLVCVPLVEGARDKKHKRMFTHGQL